MSEALPMTERRPTGIRGLDEILGGGLLAAGVYIVQGPPGAGKTILANQVCFHHAANGDHAAYVTLLAESHSRMFSHLSGMAFFDEQAIPNHVYYVGGYSTLESAGLDGLLTMIRGVIQKQNTSLLVVDGLVSAQEASPTDKDFKRFLHELQTLADLTSCTVLLLTNAQRVSGHFPEHTMVDGVLHLTDELSELRPLRHIRILKLRGSAPVRGLHSVRITNAGFEVWPRIETHLSAPETRQDRGEPDGKLPFGIAELDDMLYGGVRPASITMLLGSSGSGKTMLGSQFLSEGVRRGEKVVYFGFYERPEALLAKCQRVGIDLASGVQRELARIVWHRPVEGVIDEVGQRLIDTVRSLRPRRLFLDGIDGLERAADFPERLSHVYSAIGQELEHLGVTTIYSAETREIFAREIEVPIHGLSAATQNIILMRHIEYRAAMLRVMAILKIRDGDYDARMREVQITNNGIRLLDTFAAESRIASGGGVSTESRTEGVRK